MRIALALCTAALAAGCASTTAQDTVALGENPYTYAAARAEVCRQKINCGGASSQRLPLRDRIRAEDQRRANAQNPGPDPVIQPELKDR
jgi:hypothetical protein